MHGYSSVADEDTPPGFLYIQLKTFFRKYKCAYPTSEDIHMI